MAEAAFFDRILETSTTTGTGPLTIVGAVTGYQTWAAVGDGNTSPMAVWEVDANGNPSGAWETAESCTYTASGTTVSRGTFKSSSTGSPINFGAGTKRVAQSLPASILNQLTRRNVSGADADTSMAVNTRYNVDMSAWDTADRTYTLPATAAVNDMVEIHITAGDTSNELIITAASGDTLNGVAGGTEWSRLLITGEHITMRCTVANATWVVDFDGRRPCVGIQRTTTAGTTNSAATITNPSASTNWDGTTDYDNGSIISDASSIATVRRAGRYMMLGYALSQGAPADAKYYELFLYQNTTIVGSDGDIQGTAGNSRRMGSAIVNAAVGDTLDMRFRAQEANMGIGLGSFLHVMEIF